MRWKRILSGTIAVLSLCAATCAATGDSGVASEEKRAQIPPPELKTHQDKLGYAMGIQIGRQLRSDGVRVNSEILAKAVRIVLEGGTPTMSPEETAAVIQKMNEFISLRRAEEAVRNLADSKKFLDENAKKEGVRTLPSGLQYQVLKEGEGAAASPEDMVKVHYRGTLLSGEEFTSSRRRGRPDEALVKDTIPAFAEAMQLMKEGSQWRLFVPPNLGYGEPGNRLSMVPPNALLIYEVELLEVTKSPQQKGQ